MRLSGTKTGAINQYRGLGNQLWDLAGNRPSLDLPFADNKSLVDATTGQNLVTFTRAGSGTCVDSEGVIRTATTNLQTFSEEFNNAAYGASAGSVSGVNAGIAPNGTSTADEITSTGGGLFRSLTAVTATVYTASVYAKYVSGGANFSFGCDSGPANGRTLFNLQTGAITSNGANVTSSSIAPVGNDWYRCTVTFTSTSTSIILVYYNATSGSNYLIWGAQLEQSATVGEYIPTTSTINSAPRFDHDPTTGESLGLLVEEQRTNLLTRSIPDAAVPTGWSVGFSTGTFSHALVNAPVRYASIHQFIKHDQTVSGRSYLSYGLTLAANTTYTFSAFFDKGSSFVASGDSTVMSVNNFAGATGTLFITLASVPASGFASITFTTGNGTTGEVRIGCGSGANTVASLTFGAWQLEAGAFPTSYIPTTDATATRAADVASIRGSNFGVSRTNLLLRSEEFDNASWNSAFGARTITPNSVAAPDGLLTADTVAADGTNAQHFVSQSLTLSAVPYAYSVFAKAGTNDFLQLRAFSGFGGMWANFNLATGVVGTVSGSATSLIQAYPNGWYRCTMVFTPTATTSSVSVYIVSSDSAVGNETNSLSTNVYIWGAQLETGSTATAYIPTTTAAVTVVESPWYRQDEGTVFAEAMKTNFGSTYFPWICSARVANQQNAIGLYVGNALGDNSLICRVSGVDQAVDTYSSASANRFANNVPGKICGTYKLNDFAMSTNGQSTRNDTLGQVPSSLNELLIGNGDGIWNGTIRRLTYWPARLPNETLQTITQ